MVWRPLMHVYEEQGAETYRVEYYKRRAEDARHPEVRSGLTVEQVVAWALEPPELKTLRWYDAAGAGPLDAPPESIRAAFEARGKVVIFNSDPCSDCGDKGLLSNGAICPRCQIVE